MKYYKLIYAESKQPVQDTLGLHTITRSDILYSTTEWREKQEQIYNTKFEWIEIK